MSRPHHLFISPELRQVITSLQVRFWNDYWQHKFESVDDETRPKYGALVGSMYKILDGKGTQDDFVTMSEACVPTEWLVTFLDQWIIKGLNNQVMENLIITDNQGFHQVSVKISNSPDDSPDQVLNRIKF
jgi:hypothetical protein